MEDNPAPKLAYSDVLINLRQLSDKGRTLQVPGFSRLTLVGDPLSVDAVLSTAFVWFQEGTVLPWASSRDNHARYQKLQERYPETDTPMSWWDHSHAPDHKTIEGPDDTVIFLSDIMLDESNTVIASLDFKRYSQRTANLVVLMAILLEVEVCVD